MSGLQHFYTQGIKRQTSLAKSRLKTFSDSERAQLRLFISERLSGNEKCFDKYKTSSAVRFYGGLGIEQLSNLYKEL
jgi:hypothetical protein